MKQSLFITTESVACDEGLGVGGERRERGEREGRGRA